MKRIAFAVSALLVLILSLVGGPVMAQAGDFVNVTFTGNGTCTNTTMTVPITNNWSVTSTVTLTYVEAVNGSPTTVSITTSLTGSGSGIGSTFNHISYSATQPYTYSFDLTYREGTTVIGRASASFTCNGGIATLAVAPASVPGPAIPGGFVLRTITCDTAIYQAAGGNPVATGEHIINGQTWFVSPTPVKDAKGTSWTEIFVAGYSDGFIPTACVGGKPAGYAGE
jgi:hypothetical protein